ncbi:unnamed protein product [Rotaria sordida]|uniref:Uncharacterized protein n=1 Tax=Rotaria sordida TaxID=392033 RepID=A0A816EH83_9BILA|nr:unnamed protein product [Rotaria sordida]
MDKETASIVSIVYAQSEILQKEVFLFERIDTAGQKSLKHLSAIWFLRPTEENIQALVRELHESKYGNYFISEVDEFECVRVVQEYYADYLAINPHLYSLNISNTYQQNYKWNDNLLRRAVQGLVSVLLSSTLKRQVDFTASNPNDINQTIVLIIDR